MTGTFSRIAWPACSKLSVVLWVRKTAVTWSLCLLAIAIGWDDSLAGRLQLDRGASLTQGWCAYTAHFVHWNGDHLFWDVLMFAGLGAVCECHSRKQFTACLLLGATAISAAIWWLQPQMSCYRGLSGLDSALFALAGIILIRRAYSERDWPILAVGCGGILAFVAKVGHEAATDATLFVNSTAAGFVPVPLAHAVGGLVGGAIGLVGRAGATRSA